MTEMKELEMELRSWQPRRPSAKLEQRLFGSPVAQSWSSALGQAATSIGQQVSPGFRLSWLAPALAGLFLVCVLFNPRNTPVIAGPSNSEPMVAMMMSNQTLAAFLPGNSQNEQNSL